VVEKWSVVLDLMASINRFGTFEGILVALNRLEFALTVLCKLQWVLNVYLPLLRALKICWRDCHLKANSSRCRQE
jgi:hypothetical protein